MAGCCCCLQCTSVHSPVDVSQVPLRMVFVLCMTVMSLVVNIAWQPLLHNCPIRISGCVMCGKTCAAVVIVRSSGISRLAVCVACIVLPLGI